MLIAEDILLLATDDESGELSPHAASLDVALAGALLVELVIRRRVTVDGPQGEAEVDVVDDSPLDNTALDAALAVLAKGAADPHKPLQSEAAVTLLCMDVRSVVQESLAARGILRRQKGRILGIIPTTRWPAVDSAHERALRAELDGVLLDGQAPGLESAVLLTIVDAAGLLPTVVPRADLEAAAARVKEIAASGTVAGDVDAAVAAAVKAVTEEITALIVVMFASRGLLAGS